MVERGAEEMHATGTLSMVGRSAEHNDATESATIHWMTLDRILSNSKTPPWIAQSMRIGEKMRLAGSVGAA